MFKEKERVRIAKENERKYPNLAIFIRERKIKKRKLNDV